MRIGIIGHNSVEYIETLFSIWNSGHSAVLIDSEAPPSAIIKIFRNVMLSVAISRNHYACVTRILPLLI